jgi:hypothetical protein
MARTQNDATRIQNIAVNTISPTDNQILKYDAASKEYVPEASVSLTSEITAPGSEHTLDEMLTDAHSSGWISGMTINDIGSGNITVDTGECFIRTTASAAASLVYRNTAALTSTAIPTDTTRYVILTYAAGTMTPSVSTTNTSNTYNIIYVGEVHNVGGTLQIHNDHRPAGDAINRFQTAWSDIVGIRVKSGEVASESAALKLAVSVGAINDRFGRPLTTAAFDSNVAGTFTLVYRNGGDFTRVTGQTTLPVTVYDGGAGLAAMTGGKYANLWVIRGINGNICVQYGQAEYATQVLAEAESQPATRPEEYDEHGFYVAQLTFLKSAASLASITVIKPIVGGQFGAAATATPTAHNDLSAIQGGIGGQYYHLTSAEYTGSGTGAFARTTSPVFTTPNIGSATGSISGNAATVTGATLTTALTVNTGTVTLTGNVANTSALTIGAGAVSVSGANTGDQTNITGNAATASAVAVGGITGLGTGVATALAVNVGTAGAPVVNGGALGTPASGTLTNCTFPTLNQDTTGKSAKTNALNSATTVVSVSAATAPSSGQVLTATSSTAATWQTPSSTGYVVTTVTTATSNPSDVSGQRIILCNYATADTTITLPTAVGNTATFTIKKIDGSAFKVIVATTSSQTIDGVSSFPLSFPQDTITLVSDNANWKII